MPDPDESDRRINHVRRRTAILRSLAGTCILSLTLGAMPGSSQPIRDAREIELFGGVQFIPWIEEAGPGGAANLGSTAWLWNRWGLSAEILPFRAWEDGHLNWYTAGYFYVRHRIQRSNSTWYLGFGGAVVLPDVPKRHGRREIPPLVPVPVFDFLVGPEHPGGWDVRWGARVWGFLPQLVLQVSYTPE